MNWYYILAIEDNGVKKYYAESGWTENKGKAARFGDYQDARGVAFDEDLEESEFEIIEGRY